MHINEIISFFYMEKNTHFLKSFYNSLNCKKTLLSVHDNTTLEEEKSLL